MKNSQPEHTSSPDAFLSDLRTLVAEAEKLLSDADRGDGAGMGSALRERFEAAQERFTDLYAGARKRIISGGRHTDKAIRDNPYQAMAIAAGVGLLIGALIGRRSR